MRIYISGQITGIPYEQAKRNFDRAAEIIRGMGHEPVNPTNNGLPVDSEWRQHMVKDIELLLGSDAIFLLDGWKESKEATIEWLIAQQLGLRIYDGRGIVQNNTVERIKAAIHRVTGMHFEQYTTKSRKRETFYARMLFAEHCTREGLRATEVARMVNRDRTTVLNMLRVYRDDVRFNPHFRDIAQGVELEVSKLKERKNGKHVE